MGARRGGRGALAPPLEFEKMTSYAAVLQNTLNFSLAPSALATDTLYFSLKRRKKRNNFRLRLRRAQKWLFFVRRAENLSTFLSVSGFAPLWKNFCGRPCRRKQALRKHPTFCQAE